MNSKSMTYAACVAALAGILLHIYLTLVHTMGGSAYFYVVPAMNVIPYIVCFFLALITKKPVMALVAAIMLLLMDIYLFQEYFFSTRAYRFMFIEMMQILIKTVVIVPLGCLVGFLIQKAMKKDGEKEAG